MRHAIALLIKFAAIATVLFSLLGIFYNATLGEILSIAIITTLVAYVLGDLFLLPRFGNLVATIADFGLAFLAVWALGSILIEQTFDILTASFFAALAITVVEAFFHIYMANRVLNDGTNNRNQEAGNNDNTNFVTEFAEEFGIGTNNQNNGSNNEQSAQQNQSNEYSTQNTVQAENNYYTSQSETENNEYTSQNNGYTSQNYSQSTLQNQTTSLMPNNQYNTQYTTQRTNEYSNQQTMENQNNEYNNQQTEQTQNSGDNTLT